MILIGSRALNEYVPLNRVMHDYDFIMSKEEFNEWLPNYVRFFVKKTDYSYLFEVNNEIVEVRNPDTLDPTDLEILKFSNIGSIETPYGRALLASFQTLFDIKVATSVAIPEYKHLYDVGVMLKHSPVELVHESPFYKKRLEEIRARQSVSKKIEYDFFHKYHIPEYIRHDLLHEIIADLIGVNIPTYLRITTAETDISEELFNKLTHDQKVNLMVEESLVLNLERWYVPQNVENGINYKLMDHFYNNNEAMPTYLILKHVNLTGLKGEAKYITDFSKANFFEIEKKWREAKEAIKNKGGFPSWFHDEIYKVRKEYREKGTAGTA